MADRDGLRMYILTCGPRLTAGVLHRTLASVARSDWSDQPVLHLDDRADGDPKVRQTENYRSVLERISRERPVYALVLEDDVAVNRHLRANLAAWQPVRERWRPLLASLYNPNLVPLTGAPSIRNGFVVDTNSVYGSQAFLLTPDVADFCLEHWHGVPAMQDIKLSRLAALLGPHAMVVHRPSLVEHDGATLSTHGGAQHTAIDFDPWWRAGEETAARSLNWDRIPGWFDWPAFYEHQVRSLPHGAVVVEVGVFLGRSITFLAQTMKAVRKDLQVFAVDTFVGCVSDSIVLETVHAHGGSLRSTFEQNLAAAGVSDAVEILALTSVEAAQAFGDGSVDLVFLDGDHSTEGLTADLLAWLPKVWPGGMIAGHDIDTYPSVRRALDRVLGASAYGIDHGQNLWFLKKG